MKSRFPEETTIRQYLLGQLHDQQELEESLSEEMLFNDELSEIVDSIEDEIIEEYLDETLTVADQRSFEKYFLRPQERKEKLRFAELLRQHFDSPEDYFDRQEDRPVQQTIPAPVMQDAGEVTGTTVVATGHWRAHNRTYLELVALLVLTISTLAYIAGLQNKLSQSTRTQIQRENELKQERERYATLAAEMPGALQPFLLTLQADKVFRSDDTTANPLPKAEIGPATRRISVSLLLEQNLASAYDVRLESPDKKQIWSARFSPLVSSSGGAQLAFDIPAEGINDGEYSFAVAPVLQSGNKTYQYRFLAHKAK